MRVVLQRVTEASVEADKQIVGEISGGLLIFAGIALEDNTVEVKAVAQKVVRLRIFENELHKFDKSLLGVNGEVLVIPQFTLFAATKKGRRPDFTEAAPPKIAVPLFESFIKAFRDLGVLKVASGVFGAHMLVRSVNDGPVTIPMFDRLS